MVMEFTNEITEDSMKECMKQIKNMDMESTLGTMEEFMMDSGKMVNKMDTVNIRKNLKMDKNKNFNLANGKMVRKLLGLLKMNIQKRPKNLLT